MYLVPNSNSDKRFCYKTRSPSPLAMKPSYMYHDLNNLHDSATGSSDGVSPFSSNSLSGTVSMQFLSLFKTFLLRAVVFREAHLALEHQLFMELKIYILDSPDVLHHLDSFHQGTSKTRSIIWDASMQIWQWRTRCFKRSTIHFGKVYSTSKASIHLWHKFPVKHIVPYSRPSRVQILLHRMLEPASNSLT